MEEAAVVAVAAAVGARRLRSLSRWVRCWTAIPKLAAAAAVAGGGGGGGPATRWCGELVFLLHRAMIR